MGSSAVRSLMCVSASIAAVVVQSPQAIAQEASRTYVIKDETTTTGPNRALLRSGIWTLGLAYVPAVIVATQSERDADKRLYIPVAGPWLDLANRGKCPPNSTCNHETTNKVLLAVDGVFQGIGALNILGAFLFPETRTVTVGSNQRTENVRSSSFRIVPTRIAGAYGLLATGSF